MEENTQKATAGKISPGELRITGKDAEMVLAVILVYREKLCGLKSNPKGLTHGDVQNHLAACDRILG